MGAPLILLPVAAACGPVAADAERGSGHGIAVVPHSH